jgi:hypothetical protein
MLNAEGGRTTRGTVPAAERCMSSINQVAGLSGLDAAQRSVLVDELQRWLAGKAREYLNRERLLVTVNLDRLSTQIIGDILDAAGVKRGAVAQHIVGAKLAVRFPNRTIENHSYTTADQQLGRAGDFLIGNTVFHVTIAPMHPLVEKCRQNLQQGYRVVVLAPAPRVLEAQGIFSTSLPASGVWVTSIESFVGQNIEELSEFTRTELVRQMKALLVKYNERVQVVETDPSSMIEIPANIK